MKIRPSTRKDIRGMVAVEKDLLPTWPASAPIDLYYERGFVAVDGKTIVGFVSCCSENGNPRISSIKVDPTMHRKGIGSKLVAAAEEEARKAGAGILQVMVMGWTQPLNRKYAETRKFYKALGFKVAEKHPMHVKGEDRWRYYTLEKKLSRTRLSGVRR